MRVASRFLSTAAVAAALTVALMGGGVAQEATPGAMGEHHPMGPIPNHLHKGTCDNLDEAVAAPLADLQFPDWVAALSGMPGMDLSSANIDPSAFGNAPIPATAATTEVPMALADIMSGKHALAVDNPDNPDEQIACGNIGGIPNEQGDLFVGLGESNGSGFTGVVWLHDNAGTSTTVVVVLNHTAAQPAIAAALATLAAATPAAGAPAATPVAPEMTPTGTPVA
jgi:hypothetical protein